MILSILLISLFYASIYGMLWLAVELTDRLNTGNRFRTEADR